MHDPFEESLRDLLRGAPAESADSARLDRVLKAANRQVGAGDLFNLLGHWFEALMIGLDRGAARKVPATRRLNPAARQAHKAE
ncbi:CrfX protein [Pseudomonas sp. MAP12]|uniref:CrfX protein n=1 Tax=Geopseudomonas aromaticivorans TaxID=2849492 RepID=A0ABS6MS94_9GAMM|nr:CrfX protein [Pseudomonas aromaticivorans]MBV2131231.1 CrfX protein [Pseudomonas aromaticivorans]